MIVYHGSNSNFNQLKISRNLVHWEKEHTDKDEITFKFMPLGHTEDIGIYFSTDKETAKQYGKYLYTLEINDKYVKDFKSRTICRLFLAKMAQEIYRKLDVDLLEYINLEQLSEQMYWHKIGISTIYSDIEHILYYDKSFSTLSPSKIDRVNQMIRAYCKKEATVFMFNSNVKGEGIIKKIEDDIVKIIHKEQSY